MNPRVAIVDSGVNAGHPHVGPLFAGARVRSAPDGTPSIEEGIAAARDEIGHGTACAGLVRWLAPAAEIVAVRIFDAVLRVEFARLAPALDFARDRGCQVVNLSLGASGDAAPAEAREALERLLDGGAWVVCAAGPRLDGWPASHPRTLAVAPDRSLASGVHGVIEGAPFPRPKPLFLAAPYPRPMPGLPRERNLAGSSFAAAALSGILARDRVEGTTALDPRLSALVRFPDLDTWRAARAQDPATGRGDDAEEGA
ncbi:MAG: S8 family serine peptidase [Candidatus Eisenbacteria bacterium]|nr:S8 family serine peptidase [Candidatus Eisenbacteria bacterium]